jgi:hypothetical protein
MIDHLQPKISEFLIEFEQIKTKQEQLNYEAKVRYKQARRDRERVPPPPALENLVTAFSDFERKSPSKFLRF